MPKFVTAGGRQGLDIEFGISSEFPIDDRHDRALGAELGEQLSSRARPESMKSFDPAPELHARDDVGGDLSNRPESCERSANAVTRTFRAQAVAVIGCRVV